MGGRCQGVMGGGGGWELDDGLSNSRGPYFFVLVLDCLT